MAPICVSTIFVYSGACKTKSLHGMWADLYDTSNIAGATVGAELTTRIVVVT